MQTLRMGCFFQGWICRLIIFAAPRQRGLWSSVQEMQNAAWLCLKAIQVQFSVWGFSMVAVLTGSFPSLIFYLTSFTLVAACTAERSSCLFGGVGSILHHQLRAAAFWSIKEEKILRKTECTQLFWVTCSSKIIGKFESASFELYMKCLVQYG